jgi:hypothetical protein
LAKQASQAVQAGNKNLAIYYYRQALAKEPAHLEWRLWVAEALLKRGNLNDAEAEAREALKLDAANARALKVIQVATAPPPKPKSKEEQEREEEAIAVSSVPFPEPSTVSLPKAMAAWVEGDVVAAAEKINTHNRSVSKSQQFYYFFVDSGTLAYDGGQLQLGLDLQPAIGLSERIQGDSFVIPTIKGQSRLLGKASRPEWERVAAQIAAKIEADSHVAAVLFDIEPHDSLLHFLYAGVKKGTRKPVLCVEGDRMTFKYVDAMVARCFTTKNAEIGAYSDVRAVADLGAFNSFVESVAGQYLRNARAMGGKLLVGVPAAATVGENEGRSKTQGIFEVKGKPSMLDFFTNALARVENLVMVNDDAFLGVAVWGILPPGGVKHGLFWYHPSEISAEEWERLKTPLIRR